MTNRDRAGLTSRRKSGRLFAVGALVVAVGAFIVITAGGIGENLVYYWGPKDIQEAGDKAIGATIRLGGLVKEGSIQYAGGTSGLSFDVIDDQALVHVRSQGVPPQMFREGIGVVVEGTMTDAGHFESSRLMVSHDNEYRAPEDMKDVDIEQFIKSAEGISGDTVKGGT